MIQPNFVLIPGNCLSTMSQILSGSVQTYITSPPYWGLRDYGVDDQLGREATPEEYVENLVKVFREVHRILRDDGTLWLNLGDSYNGSGGAGGDYAAGGLKEGQPKYPGRNVGSLKPKDLVGIPWRVAFALQADGWYLRQDIIWSKPNPMPESVTDRCTKAHEYIFLLSKSERYYYDQDAIREAYAPASLPRALRGLSNENKWSDGAPGSTAHAISQGRPNRRKNFEATHGGGGSGFAGHSGYVDANGRLLVNPNGRNRRSVWTINTQSYKEAHFATFPPKLIEPCILAGTSERGCCPKCGAPRERVVEKGYRAPAQEDVIAEMIKKGVPRQKANLYGGQIRNPELYDDNPDKTIGWQPTCTCFGHFEKIEVQESYQARSTGTHDTKIIYVPDGEQPEPAPCIVFDPFTGSGTTGAVALSNGRCFIGTELNPEYVKIAKKRIGKAAVQMHLGL